MSPINAPIWRLPPAWYQSSANERERDDSTLVPVDWAACGWRRRPRRGVRCIWWSEARGHSVWAARCVNCCLRVGDARARLCVQLLARNRLRSYDDSEWSS